jgi:RNA polymerase sigma-70 factor (ECF subfamily)
MTDLPHRRNSKTGMYLATATEGPPEPIDPLALYERELTYVWNALRRLGISDRDLEDRTHDVFATAIERLPAYDPSRPLRPWLFGIVFRIVVGARRLKPAQSEIFVANPEAVDASDDPEAAASAKEEAALVQRALDQIPLERRAVVVMHDLDDCSMPEIAAALDLRLNTAYSRLRVGRAELIKAIRRLRGRQP